MRRVELLILIFILFLTGVLTGNTIEALKTNEPPKIDGVLDDTVWQQAKGYSGFASFSPKFGLPAKQKTVVFTAYDEHHLYFAIKCYDDEPDKIIATMYKRDGSSRDDKVGVFIDSHDDGQNAYTLICNPFGIQTDGMVDSDIVSDMSQDFLWESNGQKNSEGYVVEIKVPFQSLRFSSSKVVSMKIGFWRSISRYSEQYSFPELKLGQGSLVGQFPRVKLEGIKYKRIFEVLPAVIYTNHKQRDVNDNLVSVGDNNVQFGLTSKIGINSDLTLDVAVNPDFSHIESDEGQVDVNLRVDALYEEKRPFFLEGLEHFNFAGTGSGTPIDLIVHTRNIQDPSLGLKLSGKLGKSGLVNALVAIDEAPKNNPMVDDGLIEDPGNNYYGIFRYKRILKNDSYVGALYTGKEYKDGHLRIGGIDSRIRLNGYMSLNTFFLSSFKKGIHPIDDAPGTKEKSEGWALGGNLEFENKHYWVLMGYHDLSADFTMDPGRLLRTNYRVFSGLLERYVFLNSDVLKRITLGYDGYLARDKEFEMNEYNHMFYTLINFPLSSWLTVGYSLGTEVYGGVLFKTNRFSFRGKSQPFKFLHLDLSFNTGGYPFYNSLVQGDLDRLSFTLTLQPTEKFSSAFTITKHVFHQRDTNEKLYDIGIYRNKTTYQVNKYLSLRSILEYNTFSKKLLCDALLQFTYIPGTVIHLGYGPTLEKEMVMDEAQRLQYGDFRIASSTFFFKASYLFRF